ncbi:MAG: alpha/beta fold hydrolase [Terricaulis sp.]
MLRRIFLGLAILLGLCVALLIGGYFTLRRADIPYDTLAAKYETPASLYAELPSGIRMHYRDQGARNGAAILLLHGFSASLHTWEPWVRELGGEYRVISVDLPGHGLTGAPQNYAASVESFRDAIGEFTHTIGLEHFALAGNSLGGNVAWEYALAHPDQVNALILVDASGWPESRAALQSEPPVFRLLRNPVLAPLLRDLDNTRLVRSGLESAFVDQSLIEDAMVARYSELSRAPGHRDILLQMTLGFRSRNFATPERLAALRMPTLIMLGTEDRVVPIENAQLFGNAIAGSHIVRFENVGHLPQEEAAEESAATAHEFLSAARAAAIAAE